MAERGSPIFGERLVHAAQQKLKLIFVVPCNGEYAILKEFAILEKTPNVPGLDPPGLDVVSAAKGFGCERLGQNQAGDQGSIFRLP
jgi:benzoylformate decarboxylase